VADPYRQGEPIDVAFYWGWTWRIALMVQGIPVAGLMHDLSTKAHEGICWAVSVVAVATSCVFVGLTIECPPREGRS
jgi:hypothetical protein